MPRAGIALGSNLGDRLRSLRAALAVLRGIANPGEIVLTSPVYQTEPRFCPPGSPDFLNSVVEFGFEGLPLELLLKCRAIEEKLGRTRGAERNESRTIDIDLLYFGDETMVGNTLTLPHPRIRERRFVLQPLADIRPTLVLPGETRDVATLLRELPNNEPPLIRFAEGI